MSCVCVDTRGKMFDVEAQNKSTPPLVGPSLPPFPGTCPLDTLISTVGATNQSNLVCL